MPPFVPMSSQEPSPESNTAAIATRRTTSDNQHHKGRMAQRGDVTLAEFEAYRGALPHPDMLRQFDVVVPGSAERILRMAEVQMEHRHSLEKSVVDDGILGRKQGLGAGLFVTTGCLIVSCYFASLGHAVEAGLFGGGSLASLVGVFVYGTKSRKDERVEKSKANPE